MNNEILIDSVKRRPCVWDPLCHTYHDRNRVKAAWDEISRECGADEAVVKTKWKGLRDTFRNELKKPMKICGSSNCNVGFRSQTWLWFQKMQFLKNVVKRKKTTCDSEALHNSREESDKDPENSEENIFSQSTPTSPNFPNEDELKPISYVDIGDSGLGPDTSNRKRRRETENDENVEIVRRKEPIVVEEHGHSDNLHDSVYHFAMSIVPIMRQIPMENQLRCRIRIQEMLLNELEKLNNSESSIGVFNTNPKIEPYCDSDEN